MTRREWEFLGGRLDGARSVVTVSRIAAVTGLSEDEVHQSIDSLTRQGFIREVPCG